MKRLLALLFVSWSYLCSGQVQSNCTPPSFVLNHYNIDVKNLALKRIFDLKTADTALIDIPQTFQDTILNGLSAIYNLGVNLGADSVFQKYCIHIFNSLRTGKQDIVVAIDNFYPWTQHWINYQIQTGIPALDSFTKQYGFSVNYVYNLGGAYLITLHTSQTINHLAFEDSLAKYPGIYGFYDAPYAGDGDVIFYSKDDTAQYYDFYLKWGDCPADCINAKNWKYKVDTNCVVTLLESKLLSVSPMPSPLNCYLSFADIDRHEALPTLFPNPAERSIQIINLKGPINYEVHSVEGKLLLAGSTNSKVSVANLSPGVYYIFLTSNRQQYVRRFIKH